MGNKEATSETLEKGYVESKLCQAENPCNNIPEEADSILFCNLSEKCTADGHFAGNNQINKGSLDSYAENKLSVSVNVNAINNNNVPVLEEESKISGNDGIVIGKVEEEPVEISENLLQSHEHFHVNKPIEKCDKPIEKCDNVLHHHEPGSPTKIDVSGNGINLFVEVFGPLDGISENMSGKSDSNQESSLEGNGNISPVVGEHECTFDVGDLVWIKTRTQLWWPGMISNPNNVANDVAMSEKRGSFLVKYFGNAHLVWCDNSDLKPFLECFEHLSKQNNSRNFTGSVERALLEVGRHAKSTMTCRCFSKDSQTLTENMEENPMSMEGKGKIDVLSLSQFEPAAFIAHIRHLACSVNVPGKVELTILKNRLSSFYCSMGHCELPLHLLRSGSDAAHNSQDGLNSEVIDEGNNNVSTRQKRNCRDDADLVLGDKKASSGKGFESRERKKSKYLSYPYIDVIGEPNAVPTLGQETEDLKNSSSIAKKSTTSSCSTISQKKGSKKPYKEHHTVSKSDNIDACSAELLGELCYAARDHSYLGRSKYSDSLKRFYTSFRAFAFVNADIACKDDRSQKAPKNSTEAEVKENVENAEGKKLSKTDNLKAKGHVVRKRAKKKKEQAISAGLDSKIPFNIGTNIDPSVSGMISFAQTPSDVTKRKNGSEKIEKTNPGLSDINSIPILPDLNGNQTSISDDHIPVRGPSTSLDKPLPERRNEGLLSPNIINGFGQVGPTSIPSSNDAVATPQNTPLSNAGVNGTSISFVRQSLQMGIFPSAGRKRKRKEKTGQVASLIPDLNGNVSDMSSPGKTMSDGQPPSGEIPGSSSMKRTRVVNKVEDPGGTLLLSFTPGSTLPPKETLVAKFSRFGLVKESEIQILEDSTVQIAYKRSSDARFAFRSLEKDNMFGESLASFKLNCVPLPGAARRTEKKKRNLQMGQGVGPTTVGARENLVGRGDPPDISFIRRNVETMKLTLERAGDGLSPEMRAKLEEEIRVFLGKISSMGGGSSSS